VANLASIRHTFSSDTVGEIQLSLRPEYPSGEDPAYLSRQIITYLGNKRSLLNAIGTALEKVKRRLGKKKLRTFDVFSGSGVVSRFLKAHSSFLVSNDFEDYAAVISRCYLTNRSTVDFNMLSELVADLNAKVDTVSLPRGFIEELYAPQDEEHITKQDRVFYTKENARRLDNYRRLIDLAPANVRDLLLGPLLSEASIHANTAGVFKGFYKDRRTGIGVFGGTGRDALNRILGKIELEVPILSRYECDYEVIQEDANAAVRMIKNIDLAYIDPPYNQHPYGSNYFMLNLLVNYERPTKISRVSGIPVDWRRSGYNSRSKHYPLMRDLLTELDATHLLVSFNDEGFIPIDEMRLMLAELGTVEEFKVKYNTFRGCRNLSSRSIHVHEHLFLVEKRW